MKVKVQNLTGLALVWAVAMNSGFREVRFVFGFHNPKKAKLPTQVMVSMKKDSSFVFFLNGSWVVEKMAAFRISAFPNINLSAMPGRRWFAENRIGEAVTGDTITEAVAKCWLKTLGIYEVELPPELTAGSSYPPENEHGY